MGKAINAFKHAHYPTAKEVGWKHLRMGDYGDAPDHNAHCFNVVKFPIGTDEALHIYDELKKVRVPRDEEISQMHKFLLLNYAFSYWEKVITIDPNTVVLTPILLQQNAACAGTYLPHVTINVGKNSRALLIQKFFNPPSNKNSLTSSITTINLAEGAELQVITDINSVLTNDQFHRININASKNSHITHQSLVYGKGLCRIEISAHLNEQGSSATLLGVSANRHNGQHSFLTAQMHAAPDTVSDLNFRAISTDSSTSHFRGLIRIERKAQRSNAYQKNRNLMLSKTTKAYTSPELEILANDVRCTHGATSGPLDAEQLYYAQSRGISLDESRIMMATSFAIASIEQLKDYKMRHYATRVIHREIKKSFHA